MTKTLKKAIEALHELPAERQEVIARAILDYASHDGKNIYRLSDEERRLVDEGLASGVVPDEEMEKFWNRHRV